MEPIITCKPWNPVAIKNVEPKEESDIQNGASIYSNPCKKEKITPRQIVKIKAILDLLKLFFSISWCDHVTVTPEDKSKIVFIRGILIGLKAKIVIGGHACPNSIVGEILLWKKSSKEWNKEENFGWNE